MKVLKSFISGVSKAFDPVQKIGFLSVVAGFLGFWLFTKIELEAGVDAVLLPIFSLVLIVIGMLCIIGGEAFLNTVHDDEEGL